MTSFTQRILEQAVRVEGRWDALRARLQGRSRDGARYTIVPYSGAAALQGDGGMIVRLRGRVLEGTQPAAPEEDDSLWENLLASYRRLESDEVAGARVAVTLGGVTTEARSDGEGFYSVNLRLPADAALGAEPWLRGRVRLVEPLPAEPVEVEAAVVAPRAADFFVISDIDDTILLSSATSPLRAARLLLGRNAYGRESFGGVAAFYQALQRGAGPSSWNPIVYLSSSPWNLYDLLCDFLELHAIPAGPLLLRDYGLDAASLSSLEHSGHKLTRIEELLASWPTLPCVLIGDSGQQDPEIYAEVAARHAARVRAVYIRDASAAAGETARAAQVGLLAAQAEARGVPWLFFAETEAAYTHARGLGLVQ